MAITLLTHVAAVNGNAASPITITTASIDTTLATLLVAALASNGAATAPVLSDSKGNTWTLRTTYASAGQRVQLAYCSNPVVGAGHTFTLAGATSYPALAVAGYSGTLLVSPYDTENGAQTTISSSLATGSITPSMNGEVVVTGVSWNSSTNPNTVSVDSGFTITDQAGPLSGAGLGAGLASLIQTTAGAVNPTWTTSATPLGIAAIVASFKVAVTGYSMTVDQGAYVYTGHSTGLHVGTVVQPDTGLYAVTGQDVNMLKNYVLNATTGLYVYTGSQLGGGGSRYPLGRRRGR